MRPVGRDFWVCTKTDHPPRGSQLSEHVVTAISARKLYIPTHERAWVSMSDRNRALGAANQVLVTIGAGDVFTLADALIGEAGG